MRTNYRTLLFLLSLNCLIQALNAAPNGGLQQCIAESGKFSMEEKAALVSNVRRISVFGFYAVTANNTRAAGIAIATDAQKADMVFRTMEMKAVNAFATVFHVWEEEFDRLDGMMSERGRFPAIRQMRVFYGRVAPQAAVMERTGLDDGSELMILHIPAEKVIIDREEYRKELHRKYGEALFELYVLSREKSDEKKSTLLKGDMRRVGLEAPDETILDYLQALRENDDAAAAVLLEDAAPVFRQLSPMVRKAVLKAVVASSRKEDARVLEEEIDNATKELK